MSETLKNLTKAFIGESQARNRYTFYAKKAKKEGFEQISEFFSLTAENEREHAKWLFRLINQIKETDRDEIEVEAAAPLTLGDTKENLKAAIEGENYEATDMYPSFAEKAREEGHGDIADRLEAIAQAETHHRERYKKLLKNVEDETVFEKDVEVYWVCRKCGYIHKGQTPPATCPSCSHPKNYFELQKSNY